jgi:hypothetical protein
MSDNMTQLPTVNVMNLTLEERVKHYSGLLEFVRWLLKKKDEIKNRKELPKFEERTKQFEASLDEKVNAGNLSKAQADRQRGSRIWWLVMVETQGAAASLASRIVMRKYFADSVKSFLEEVPLENKASDEIRDEIEKKRLEIENEIAEKLRQCLGEREA